MILPTEMSIYHFIVNFKREHDGNSPGFREIAEGCGFGSTNTVAYHIESLMAAGLIYRKDRRLCVHGGSWELNEKVSAGNPESAKRVKSNLQVA